MELFDEKDQERERVDNVYSGPKDDENDDLLSDDDGRDDEILSDDADDWDVDTDQVLDDDEDEIVDVTDPDDDDDDLLSDDDDDFDDETVDDDDAATETRAPQTFSADNVGFSSRKEPRNPGSILGHEPGTGVGGDI